ncbi:MAG: thiol-disulfide isomerase [Ignavibacteriales bacterium CG_4_9_14_3_um_filter_30_11]|nr:MAG: thiol-disulfide isomerase [Ignavibacteriales bacterium CG_4_9_14_3_um_filter_30_11]
MKKTAILFFIFSVVSCNLFAQTTDRKNIDVKPFFTPLEKFDPLRDAGKDIEMAIKEAQRTNRRIILDIGGEWCIWCHRIDTMFLKNPEVGKYLHDNFVVVKLNVSKENKNEKVLANYPEVPGYPHIFVLEKDGKLLISQNTGDFEKGKGHDPNIVLAFLKKWSIGH